MWHNSMPGEAKTSASQVGISDLNDWAGKCICRLDVQTRRLTLPQALSKCTLSDLQRFKG